MIGRLRERRDRSATAKGREASFVIGDEYVGNLHCMATLASPRRTKRIIMPKEPKQLDELFHDTLKDIYFAEKKILSTLPRMEKVAH